MGSEMCIRDSNGTDTASVAITKDGTTTTCKLPLKGRGKPTCG